MGSKGYCGYTTNLLPDGRVLFVSPQPTIMSKGATFSDLYDELMEDAREINEYVDWYDGFEWAERLQRRSH